MVVVIEGMVRILKVIVVIEEVLVVVRKGKFRIRFHPPRLKQLTVVESVEDNVNAAKRSGRKLGQLNW